jgi:hypothetical protein
MADEMASQTDRPEDAAAEYEPPRVEAVLTANELAREIQYAGVSLHKLG